MRIRRAADRCRAPAQGEVGVLDGPALRNGVVKLFGGRRLNTAHMDVGHAGQGVGAVGIGGYQLDGVGACGREDHLGVRIAGAASVYVGE